MVGLGAGVTGNNFQSVKVFCRAINTTTNVLSSTTTSVTNGSGPEKELQVPSGYVVYKFGLGVTNDNVHTIGLRACRWISGPGGHLDVNDCLATFHATGSNNYGEMNMNIQASGDGFIQYRALQGFGADCSGDNVVGIRAFYAAWNPGS
jgi:hypothetical protein